MRNIVIISWLWIGFNFYSFSQVNVSFDSDCMKYNSAIISKAMIETFGEDSIKKLLDNNIQIVFISSVDSLGHILDIIKINSRQKLENNFVNMIENYLVINEVRFFICYQQDASDINKCKVIDYERKQFKKSHSRLIGSIAFPGELMNLYEYEKEKAKVQNICLSKYDYLLLQMNKYLR